MTIYVFIGRVQDDIGAMLKWSHVPGRQEGIVNDDLAVLVDFMDSFCDRRYVIHFY